MNPWDSLKNSSSDLSEDEQFLAEIGLKHMSGQPVDLVREAMNRMPADVGQSGSASRKGQPKVTAVKPQPPQKKPEKKPTGKIKIELPMELPSQTKAELNPQAVANQAYMNAQTPGGPQMAPMPTGQGVGVRGSGVTAGTSLENILNLENGRAATDDQTSKHMKDTLYNDADMMRRWETAMGSPMVQEQRGGLDRINELIALEGQSPVQTDFSPVMALVDSLYGTKLSQGYAKPETGDVKRARIIAHAQKLQDDRRDISKSVLDSLKADKAGTLTDGSRLMIVDTSKQGQVEKTGSQVEVTDPRKFDKASGKGKEYNPDKDVKDYQKVIQPVEDLRSIWQRLHARTKGFESGAGTGAKARLLTGLGLSSWQSDEAADVSMAVDALQNAWLKAQSGGQVTDGEAGRLKAALGTRYMNSKRDFRLAMIRVGEEIKEMQKTRESAYRGNHPIVIDLHEKGGGTRHETLNVPSAESSKAPKGGGKKDRSKMTIQEMEAEIKARGL